MSEEKGRPQHGNGPQISVSVQLNGSDIDCQRCADLEKRVEELEFLLQIVRHDLTELALAYHRSKGTSE